jgi:hypothetical protein
VGWRWGWGGGSHGARGGRRPRNSRTCRCARARTPPFSACLSVRSPVYVCLFAVWSLPLCASYWAEGSAVRGEGEGLRASRALPLILGKARLSLGDSQGDLNFFLSFMCPAAVRPREIGRTFQTVPRSRSLSLSLSLAWTLNGRSQGRDESAGL